MTAEQCDSLKLWVDVSQIASALAAAVGLFVAARSFRRQNNAIDISTITAFVDKSVEAEKQLNAAVGDAKEFPRKFSDYVNHLEVLAFC